MYPYTESGLHDVWLINGYRKHETPYGPGISFTDLDGLHRAIGRAIAGRPGPLTGAEFRFLRTELDMSQDELAHRFGCGVQALMLWEEDSSQAPGSAAHFLRVLYRERAEGSVEGHTLVEYIAASDAAALPQLRFAFNGGGWHAAA
jgi:DNA-binding transcriptional regulator YiaG